MWGIFELSPFVIISIVSLLVVCAVIWYFEEKIRRYASYHDERLSELHAQLNSVSMRCCRAGITTLTELNSIKTMLAHNECEHVHKDKEEPTVSATTIPAQSASASALSMKDVFDLFVRPGLIDVSDGEGEGDHDERTSDSCSCNELDFEDDENEVIRDHIDLDLSCDIPFVNQRAAETYGDILQSVIQSAICIPDNSDKCDDDTEHKLDEMEVDVDVDDHDTVASSVAQSTAAVGSEKNHKKRGSGGQKSVQELRQLAKERGIDGSKMKKSELLQILGLAGQKITVEIDH